jgi:mycothiol synthase
MVITKTQTRMRPFTLDDVQAVADLFNAYSRHLRGVDDTDVDELMNDFTTPGINLEETVRVVENDNGEIVGYIDVWDVSEPHVIKYVWGILHPDIWDDELYRQILSWAEGCARARVKLAPENTRVVINHGTMNKDIIRKKALENYGYSLVRHFFRMEIDLNGEPDQPILPEGLTIVPIKIETELRAVITVMEEAFKDHWGYVEHPLDQLMEHWEHFIENDKDFDPNLWYLAKDGEEIVGVCRCSGKMIEDPDMAWVNQLCVRKPWRRQGLGMALLLTSFNEFFRRGKKRVGLGVDASSLTNATRLYERAGMHVSEQYDTYELELRSGEDLSTQ